MARASFSTTTSERVKIDAGASPAAAKTRCSGRSRLAPAATRISAPSPMKAVLSANATSPSADATLPRWAVTSGSPAASAAAIGRIVRPGSRPPRSDSSATNAPSTNTRRRHSTSARIWAAVWARALVAASGTLASGLASRISARRSVYFHSSTRRCGRPCASNRRNAASRSAAMASPARPALRAANASARACSAAVLIGRTSAFMISGRLLFAELGIAAGFELERQLLAAALHDAAAGEHVHHVGHDVVEQPLIVRDDHHGAVRRAQGVDAVGDDPQGVDVEAGIGLVEHAQPRLQQRHLQDLVALLLAAGKAHV